VGIPTCVEDYDEPKTGNDTYEYPGTFMDETPFFFTPVFLDTYLHVTYDATTQIYDLTARKCAMTTEVTQWPLTRTHAYQSCINYCLDKNEKCQEIEEEEDYDEEY
jgi:hypothetical protein